ncbi:MAG: DUF4434 domain-containing protein [Bacteroidota bacterium]|nr:DUF4434 domain-containing protein [Bacteroidota bacterium]
MKRRNFLKTCGVTSASLFLLNDTFAAVSSEYKRNPNIKPIMGSWFEFTHGFAPEGKYWNPVLPQFTEQQWKEKVKEISEAGMEYLVLMAVANDGKTFYPSKLQPRYDYVCADPLEAVLSAADECGIKFFVSNDFWADWRDGNKMMSDAEVAKLREKGMEEVAEKYSHHKSFYGWYYPNESGLWNYIDDTTINYVNNCTKIARSLTPRSVNLIAPYGTKSVRFDDKYVTQLEKLDIDIIAYQDEIGVKKTRVGTAGKYYEGLYKAHAKAGRARLWADMEIFEFEGDVYNSALIPASFERILKQMEDISPFVENILVYQYLGIMNKPGSIATVGHPDSGKLYTDYMNWLKAQK